MNAVVVTNHYTAKEAIEICSRAGAAKANMRYDKMFVSGALAGMFLSFACAASLSTNSSPWFISFAPGLLRMISAIIFPFGLVMIVVTGVDLCTGSFMVSIVAFCVMKANMVSSQQYRCSTVDSPS